MGIDDVDQEIIYTWEHVPEKLTPGHRQRSSNRINVYCAPYKTKINGEWVYSHWDGVQFINPLPKRSKELDDLLLELVNLYISKNMNKWHIKANKMEIVHDLYAYLLLRIFRTDLNKVKNPVPYWLFCMSNCIKSSSKWYFPSGKYEFMDEWYAPE